MKRFAIAYGCAALVLCTADAIWLISMSGYYQGQVGSLLRPDPDLRIAVLFYLIYLVGVVRFAILPGLVQGQPSYAATAGALLGVVAYGTYDLSNLATLSGWSVGLTIVDMAWGTALTATTAGLACAMARRLLRVGTPLAS